MFFKNMLKTVKTEITQIGTSLNETFKESNVTVSANAHVQATPVVSTSTSGNVQPGVSVTSTTTTTSYDTTYHAQPSVGVSMGVQPTVGMNVGVQPTVGMNVNMGMQPTYHSQPTIGVSMGVQNPTYSQPTVGMHMGVQPSVNMNMGMQPMQPTVGVSMGVQPTVGMNVNMGMPPSYQAQPTVGVSMGVQPTIGMNMNMGVQPTVGMNMNVGMQPTMNVNMGMPTMTVSKTTTYTSTPQPSYSPPPVYNGALAQKIIAACKNAKFANDKVQSVVTYSSVECCPINARDLLTILAFFDFIHDRVEVVNQLKSTMNIGQMSCTDAVSVMDVWGSNEKLDILQMISPLIYDRRQNAETIVGVFAFSNDKDEARKLLLQ